MEMKFEHNIMKVESFRDLRWQYSLSEVPHPPPTMEKDNYHIVPITPKDSEKMLVFLREFFFRDEPLNIEAGVCTKPEDICLELEDYCKYTINDGLSLMAISSSGCLMGVTLNGSGEPGGLEEMQEKADTCPNPSFRKILQLLTTVERNADLFCRFPDVTRILEIRIISVDGAYRGRGVATALIDKTRELAKTHKYHMLRADCTSHYSALAMARLGFQCIYTLPYEDYKDEKTGEPIFRPPLPHVAVSTYAQLVKP